MLEGSGADALSHWHKARVEALRRALRGEFDHLSPPDPQLGACFGRLFALKQIADRTGITAALGKGRLAKLGLFLALARIAHQGSRLSAVRWAEDQAVAEVLGLGKFDEDDLYAALDDLGDRQGEIEKALYRRYLQRRGQPPRLFLYDVTSRYLEGEKNELGAYGYNRDGKRGKLQIVIGLLADEEGEPLAVRGFEGNRSDPTTVVEQIKILQDQFGVDELVFVGDRGMVKSHGKEALSAAGMRYITVLTDPQIRRLLGQGTLQLSLFSETVSEVEAEGVRYILRRNREEAEREQHRPKDKLAKLEAKMQARNEQVREHPRSQPEAGQRAMAAWAGRHKLTGLVDIKLEGQDLRLERDEAAITRARELADCYVVTTDVASAAMSAQQVHDSYRALDEEAPADIHRRRLDCSHRHRIRLPACGPQRQGFSRHTGPYHHHRKRVTSPPLARVVFLSAAPLTLIRALHAMIEPASHFAFWPEFQWLSSKRFPMKCPMRSGSASRGGG